MSKPILALSAGHNPKQPGACYCDSRGHEWTEYELAVLWCGKLRSHMRDAVPEIKVIQVPSGSLKYKVEFVNSVNPVMAIEIHFNACGGKGAGCETLYCPGSVVGKKVAAVIHREIATVVVPDRGIKEGWYRQDRPGIKDYKGDVEGDEAPVYFLRATKCPAIILEPEFIHNIDLIKEYDPDIFYSLCTGIKDAFKGLGRL